MRADRRVVLRTSIVLDRDTPALDRLSSLVRAGLGGRVGSGRQWFPWIHVEDWLRVVRWSLDPERALSGVVLATAPDPVRNAELMASLRAVLHRPWAPPTPEVVVRLGSLVLRTDPALGLTGRRAVSARLREAGLQFRHPDLQGALHDLFAAA